MARKFIVLALCVAFVVGTGVPAAKYPAVVNPHDCPNYPYCGNVLLASHSTGHHGAVENYATPTYAAYGHHGVVTHGAGAKYPAGVDPHLCPNYPYCDNVALAVQGGHGLAGSNAWSRGLIGHGWDGVYGAPAWSYVLSSAHHGAGARYPAGVNPHTCPNYPYCH